MKSSVARNPERELFRMLGQQSTARDLRPRVEKVQLLLEPPIPDRSVLRYRP